MAISIGNTDSREFWWLINRTSSIINIGDLPEVPGVKPGRKVDLLRYYSKDRISDSSDLKGLMNTGKATVKKVTDGSSSTSSNPDFVSSIEKEEVNTSVAAASVTPTNSSQVYTTDDVQSKYDNLLSSINENGTLEITSGNYSVSGTLSTALAAEAITEVVVNISTNETISSTGTLTLWNSSNNTELISYSAVSNEGNIYTFTVSTTLSNSYSTGSNIYTNTDRTITIDTSDDRINVVSIGAVNGLSIIS